MKMTKDLQNTTSCITAHLISNWLKRASLVRQAVIHLLSRFSIYRLLVSEEGGEGAFQKLCTAANDLQLRTDATSLGQVLVSHLSNVGNASVRGSFQVTMNNKAIEG